MPVKTKKKSAHVPAVPLRNPDILDVHKAAALLTVSADTVYDLFNSGKLPGRKVGRKWITTRAAVLRWVEGSFAGDALERAVQAGEKAGISKALQSGKVRAKGEGG